MKSLSNLQRVENGSQSFMCFNLMESGKVVAKGCSNSIK